MVFPERRGKILATLLLALGLALGACSDDESGGNPTDGIGGKATPSIVVTPAQVTLEQVAIGDEVQKSVTIRNLGTGTLRITEVILHEEAGGQYDVNQEFFKVGDGWKTGDILLEQNETHTLDIAYRPVDQTPDRGTLVIRSNDPARADVRVPIVTQGLAPEIFSPPTVSWPRLSPVIPADGEPAWPGGWKITQVQNVGEAPLKISEILIEESDRFRITIPQPTDDEIAEGTIPDVERDAETWPAELAPGEKFAVRVWFKPIDDSPVSGKLVFKSNDPRSPVYSVNLIGNSGAPCLALNPNDAVAFGQSAIGMVSQKTVTIQNCSSNSALKLSDIKITNDGGGVFEIQPETLPGNLPDEEFELAGGQMSNFVVTFVPGAEDSYEGELTVFSNDPANPQYRLAINGRGTNNACPTAVATATVQGVSSSRPSTDIIAAPLATIQFDGSRSSDPDGRIARYEWTLLSKPRDSNEIIRPQGSANPTLFLDMVGEYKVELKVYDEQNTASCGEPMILTILSKSEKDILIQIAWQTPAHPSTNTGGASDVDLHYLHPNASRWNAAPWDCYYANKNPLWAPSPEYGNPSLDIDRISTGGPENISHSRLEFVTYKAGVYYYSDHGHGPSYVTVRIFRSGAEVYTFEDKFMTNQQFWDVARIDGRTLNVTPIDVITQGYP